MANGNDVVLILGSGPDVVRCRDWPRAPFDTIVTINNAWSVRPDWDVLVAPEDFARDRMPVDVAPHQRLIGAEGFVPAQNRYGGFVFAGGTMAFTTAYWALDALRPRVMAFLGCDMVYAPQRQTHFYGTGTADPLRDDLSLRDLGAKSARLAAIAAAQGCACVNLSQQDESRLMFPRATVAEVAGMRPLIFAPEAYDALRAQENALGYDTPTGRYWEEPERFDLAELDRLDGAWRALYAQAAG